jgi:hypothetical protein
MNNENIATQQREREFGPGGESHVPIPSPPTPSPPFPGPAPMPPVPPLPGDPQPPIEEPPPEEQPPPIGDPPLPRPPAVGAAGGLPWQSVAGEEDPGSALDLTGTRSVARPDRDQEAPSRAVARH